jgi:hypothetical protein
LREERRLRVFENRALRRIFGAKRDGVTGEWRILHSTSVLILTADKRPNQEERDVRDM